MTAIIRKLAPVEYGDYRAHLLRLDRLDRGARFHGAISDHGIDRHVETLSWPRTRVIGVFIDGELRAAAELQMLFAHWAGTEAELALSCERDFQGQGLGTGLVRRAMLIARNRGVRRLRLLYQATNHRMRCIALKLDGVTLADGTEMDTVLPVVPADFLSVSHELFEDGRTLLTFLLQPWRGLPVTPGLALQP